MPKALICVNSPENKVIEKVQIVSLKKRKRGKRKGKGIKGKGPGYEREICKILSLWISGGTNEDLFWRSAMSGGRATVAHRKGKINRQAGDICAVSPEAHHFTNFFFVECKRYKKLQIDKFIIFNEGTLAKFWQVCVKQAADHGRRPMLIARENGMPTIVVTQVDDLEAFCFCNGQSLS